MPCVDRGLGLAGLKTFAWTPGGTPFLVVLMTIARARDRRGARGRHARTAAHRSRVRGGREASRARRRGVARRDRLRAAGRLARRRAARAAAVARACRRLLPRRRRLATRSAREHDCEPAASAAGRRRLRRRRHRDDVGDAGAAGRVAARRRARARGRRQRSRTRASSTTRCSSARRAIYVDSREQAREEAGDLIEPAAAAVVRWDDVHELQDVVAGTVAGPRRRGRHPRLQVERARRVGPRGRRARRRAARSVAPEL